MMKPKAWKDGSRSQMPSASPSRRSPKPASRSLPRTAPSENHAIRKSSRKTALLRAPDTKRENITISICVMMIWKTQ